MGFSFENNTMATMATVSKPKPTKATKRKADTTANSQDKGPVKKQKLDDDAQITTGPFAFSTLPEDIAIGAVSSLCSSDTSRSSTPASTSPDGRKISGRPKTKQIPLKLSTRCLKRTTVLRRNRPVQTSLPQDVWINIFIHSKPEFLFKARAFASGFKDAISLDSTWKGSLLEEFGPLLPDPPQGLSYMQYANLLARHGCQGCNEEEHQGRGKARRTYWAFQRRYCETCLVGKVIYERQLKRKLGWTTVHPYIGKMMDCLPQAKYDSWGHYQWVGDYEEAPAWATKYPNSQKTGFLEPAMDELKVEVEAYLIKNPTEDDVEAWFDAKIAANKILVAQLQAVEDFCEKRRIAKLDVAIKSKDARKLFYQEKAGQADPPIALTVLADCESYKRAVNIHRPAVNLERSWLALLPKLEKDRVEVEARQDEERRREEEEERRREEEEERRKEEEEERKREEEERERQAAENKRHCRRAHCHCLMQTLLGPVYPGSITPCTHATH